MKATMVALKAKKRKAVLPLMLIDLLYEILSLLADFCFISVLSRVMEV